MKNKILLILMILLFCKPSFATELKLSEYIYNRIQFYQQYEGYGERTFVFWLMYEKLKEMELNND